MIRLETRYFVALGAVLLLAWTLAACGGGAASENVECDSREDCEDDQICWRSSPGSQGQCENPLLDPPLSVGEECSMSGQCETGLCHEGECTQVCESVEDCGEEMACRSVEEGGAICEPKVECDGADDCGGDLCVVDRNGDVELYCNIPVGPKEQGEACDEDGECEAGLCLDGTCSAPCESPDDCAGDATFVCTGEDLGDGESTHVCVDQDVEYCSRDDDCTDGEVCAVVANHAASGIETVCLPDNGGAQTGMACDEDADCASRYCHDGSCTTPCETYEQCDTYQVCDQTSVLKDGESADLDLCTSLDVMACMSPPECDLENTTCNSPTFDDDGFVDGAACGVTYPGEAPLGQECSEMSDCESAYCWVSDDGSTGECTVFCQDTAQDCASGQSCVGRVAGLGVCLGDCERSADCEGGNVCKLGSDPDNTELYRYCGNTLPEADKKPGDECSADEECETGLCLSVITYEVTEQSCSDDDECESGFECSCPPGEPDCGAEDTVCVAESGEAEDRCSELCDPAHGNADCEEQGHDLTECSDTIEIVWGDVETTTAACTFPEE